LRAAQTNILATHHVDEWSAGGPRTSTTSLRLRGHYKLLDKGWRTRKLATGETQWIPLSQLGLPAGTNSFHYPERLFTDIDDDP